MARGVATLFSKNGKRNDNSKENEGDSDDYDELYAGGEMSAMAIETPKSDIDMKVKKLLEKASLNPTSSPPISDKKKVKSIPQRLNGTIAPIPEVVQEEEEELAEIGIIFWKNGFTSSTHEHRKLFSNDDPKTAELLQEIEEGFIPLEVLGNSKSRPGLKLKIILERKLDEKWIPSSFDGIPKRLGDTPTFPPLHNASHSNNSVEPIKKEIELPNYDSSLISTKIQIKIKNLKLIVKCNPLNHCIRDLYDAIKDYEDVDNNFVLHSLRPPVIFDDREDGRSINELVLCNATLIYK